MPSSRKRRRGIFLGAVHAFRDRFLSNVDNWTAGTSTSLTFSDGNLRIENTATANGYAFIEISITSGIQYTATVLNSSSAGDSNLRVGTTENGVELGEDTAITPSSTGSVTFTPTTDTVFITYRNEFNGSGSFRLADNVVVEVS